MSKEKKSDNILLKESKTWIPSYLASMSVSKKLLSGFGSVLVVLIILVAFINIKLLELQSIQERVVDLRYPTAQASERLINNINQSLAALRGYMILNNSKFKAEREAVWQNIDDQVAVMEEKSKSWTVPKNVEHFNELKGILVEFRQAQADVEAVSHTIDEQPALKVLIQEAAPRASVIAASITELIDLEGTLAATPERKRLLGMFADSRGSFALGLAAIRAYLLTGDEKWSNEFKKRWEVNVARLEMINKHQHLLNPEQVKAFKRYADNLKQFSPLPDKMFSIRSSKQWNMANYLLGTEAAPRAAKALTILKKMAESQNGSVKAEVELLSQNFDETNWVSIVSCGIGTLFVILFSWLISRSIIEPLNNLKSTISSLEKTGDFSARVDIISDDEVGETANALNALFSKQQLAIQNTNDVLKGLSEGHFDKTVEMDLRGDLKELGDATNQSVESMRHTIFDVKRVLLAMMEGDFSQRVERDMKGEFLTLKQATNEGVESVLMAINEINRIMGSMAKNDLSERVEVDLKGDLGKLANATNQSIASLSTAFKGIADDIIQVATASGQTSSSISQVSDGAQNQLHAIGQITDAVRQTGVAVADVARDAEKASNSAETAVQVVKSGQAKVERMMGVVNIISKNSEQIYKITDVIGSIANQTNMLSLNAAIEAARAGEHGTGFAVVAEEVRKLAEHSANSVQEITELVNQAVSEASNAVDTAKEVNGDMNAILDSSDEISGMLQRVAAAMEEQSATVTEINSNMDSVKLVAQSNAAASEEITTTVLEASRLTSNVRNQVGQFSLVKAAQDLKEG